MTRKRPEFKAHDEYIFEPKKIGKPTREIFIKYIRNTHDQIRKLIQIILQYSQKIETFEENEIERESAEYERVVNEEERISKDDERDSKIEAFVEDVSDRVDNKVDVSELELYAKKEQEDWITPTLVNGFSHSFASNPVSYMKDEFGFVHFKGAFEGSWENNNILFTLPLGYRPKNYAYFVCNGGNEWGRVSVTVSGHIQLKSTGSNGLGLDSITFFAEG